MGWLGGVGNWEVGPGVGGGWLVMGVYASSVHMDWEVVYRVRSGIMLGYDATHGQGDGLYMSTMGNAIGGSTAAI